jgi:hypothetical protein
MKNTNWFLEELLHIISKLEEFNTVATLNARGIDSITNASIGYSN